MASVAVSFLSFNDCNSFIAFKPIGVAALSRPSILALTFIKIEPIAGWFLGTPGKSLLKSGLIILPKKATTPPRSPIFINPNQSDKIPVRPMAISKAVAADENDADITVFQISKSPKKIVFTRQTTKVSKKNAIQM
jgi:hypothetical protein